MQRGPCKRFGPTELQPAPAVQPATFCLLHHGTKAAYLTTMQCLAILLEALHRCLSLCRTLGQGFTAVAQPFCAVRADHGWVMCGLPASAAVTLFGVWPVACVLLVLSYLVFASSSYLAAQVLPQAHTQRKDIG